MGELINLADRPEFRANLIQQLADAEEQVEVWQEQVDELRGYLGELSVDV